MFEKPETYEGLDLDALRALSAEAMDEARGIMAADDADLTDEQIADAEKLMAASAEIDAEIETREVAEAARAEKIAALRGKAAAPDPEPVDEAPEEEPEPEPEPTEDADESVDDEAESKKEEVVVADARRRTVAIARENAPEPPAPAKPAVSLIASGKSMATMAVNEEFTDLTALALEFAKTARRGPSGDMSKFKVPEAGRWGLSPNHTRSAFAKFQREETTHQIGSRMSADEQMRVIQDAGRAPSGGAAALVAAGGWCAPSETMYDFCSYETVSGVLDIPTITVSRGGINFSKGPDYSTIAADAASGFFQTEAEAEAGTTKVCLSVDCPPFTEIRLDVMGFCLTNGILTDVAYPELTRRYLEILAVAHAHAMNKYVIDAIVTAAGTAINGTEQGSTTADILDILNLQAWRLRTMYAMGPNATIEGFMPSWTKPLIQADLSRRSGVDSFMAVSDAMINSFLAARNLRIQFVEDFLPLDSTGTTTWTDWPASTTAVLYPAGAFIKGTTNVIDLDTIYDSVGLSTNTYTAAFMEEGVLVANRCASAVAVDIDLCNLGTTGAHDITCVVPTP